MWPDDLSFAAAPTRASRHLGANAARLADACRKESVRTARSSAGSFAAGSDPTNSGRGRMAAIWRAAVLGAGLTLLATTAASAQERRYTYVPIGGFGNNAYAGSHANDINESGRVVGFSGTNALGDELGFLWQDGRMATLGALYGRGSTQAHDINDVGDIVGSADIRSSESHYPVLYRDGELIPLGTGYGAGSYGAAHAINNDGVIVGERRRRPGGGARVPVARRRLPDLGSLGGESPSGTARRRRPRTSTTAGRSSARRTRAARTARCTRTSARTAACATSPSSGDESEATQAFAINQRGRSSAQPSSSCGLTVPVLWERTARSRARRARRTAAPRDINEHGQVVGYSNTGATAAARVPVGRRRAARPPRPGAQPARQRRAAHRAAGSTTAA